jgi:hypothetical protein
MSNFPVLYGSQGQSYSLPQLKSVRDQRENLIDRNNPLQNGEIQPVANLGKEVMNYALVLTNWLDTLLRLDSSVNQLGLTLPDSKTRLDVSLDKDNDAKRYVVRACTGDCPMEIISIKKWDSGDAQVKLFKRGMLPGPLRVRASDVSMTNTGPSFNLTETKLDCELKNLINICQELHRMRDIKKCSIIFEELFDLALWLNNFLADEFRCKNGDKIGAYTFLRDDTNKVSALYNKDKGTFAIQCNEDGKLVKIQYFGAAGAWQGLEVVPAEGNTIEDKKVRLRLMNSNMVGERQGWDLDVNKILLK